MLQCFQLETELVFVYFALTLATVEQYIFQDFCLGCHGQVGVQDFRSASLELINVGICGLMNKTVILVASTPRPISHQPKLMHLTEARLFIKFLAGASAAD